MPENNQPGGTGMALPGNAQTPHGNQGQQQQQGGPAQNGQGQGGTPGQGGQSGAPPSFDEWLQGQDETVKALYESHTKGLRSALESERTQRGELAKQLREAAGKAEKGSDLERALTEATGRLEAAERRATFLEEASKPEIGCANPRAAYLLAQAGELWDRRGNPDWAAIRAAAPELFGTGRQGGAGTPAHAGAGTGRLPGPAGGMNDFIRRAGRRG